MKRPLKSIIFCAVVLVSGVPFGKDGAAQNKALSNQPLRFTILYDNYLHKEGTKPDWGFSCLVEGLERTVLFDTGADPRILMHNVTVLGVDLKKVDLIVISHDHADHTGGLSAVLERNSAVTVYFPASFPAKFGRRVESLGAKARTVDKPVEICRSVHLTGEMGDKIKEQSLIIDTAKGLIIVTGCSHQGIVNILRRAKEIRDKPIALVFGGFHLGSKSAAEMQEIIADFKSLGVERCGATHCTGDAQIAMFKKAFGANYVPMGTGRVIEAASFQAPRCSVISLFPPSPLRRSLLKVKREVIDHFEKTWRDYGGRFGTHQALYQSEPAALKQVAPSGVGPEIGVGAGRFAMPLAVRFGLDPAINVLRPANR